MLWIDHVQQLKMSVVPVCDLAGQIEDILIPVHKICDKQERVSSTVARTELRVFVDFHADLLLMEQRGYTANESPTDSEVSEVCDCGGIRIQHFKGN
jgi:hypothetical protein